MVDVKAESIFKRFRFSDLEVLLQALCERMLHLVAVGGTDDVINVKSEKDKIGPFAFLENARVVRRLSVALRLETRGELFEPKKRSSSKAVQTFVQSPDDRFAVLVELLGEAHVDWIIEVCISESGSDIKAT